MSKSLWLFPVLALAGLLAGAVVEAGISYLGPETYESRAMVELKPPSRMVVVGNTAGEAGHPDFVEQEMLLLKSSPLLIAAADKGGFAKKWQVDKTGAVRFFERSITFTQLHGTDLVEIRCRHTSRDDAKDMVDAVIDAYRDRRKAEEGGPMGKALDELSVKVKEQDDRVEKLRKELSMVVRSHDLLHRDFREGESRQPAEDYVTKKRQFESELELFQTMKLKLVTETINVKMEDDPIVVHENPELTVSPSGPDMRKNLKYGMAGGVLVSQVAAFLLVVVPSRRRARG